MGNSFHSGEALPIRGKFSAGSGKRAAGLAAGALFFAMQGSEHAQSPSPRKAKILRLRCLAFQAASKKEALARGPKLLKRAKHAAATSEGQKSGEKMGCRTQRRPGGKLLSEAWKSCKAGPPLRARSWARHPLARPGRAQPRLHSSRLHPGPSQACMPALWRKGGLGLQPRRHREQEHQARSRNGPLP